MAVRLRSDRSKSTSDILDEIAYEEEMCQENTFHVKNKYRTYTFDDLGEEKKFFTKNIHCERKKEHSTQKPQNFVKKLIASLEKKNEACKADDEFLTKYYKRNDYSNPNSDYSYNSKLRFSDNIKRFNREKDISNLNIKPNRTDLDRYIQDGNIETNVLPNVETPVLSKGITIKQTYSDNYIKKDPRNKKYCCKSYVQSDLQKDLDINANNEKKVHNDFSSFDPKRSRVELKNQMDIRNTCLLKRNKSDPKRSSFERILIGFEDEKNSKTDSLKKKVNRKKSFKDFFGTMIRWKKSEKMEKPWRYMSCDHLLAQPDTFGGKNDKKLPRATSFQTMVFQDCDQGNMAQIKGREATIRPIYGGKRYEHRLETSVKKIDDRNFSIVEDNVDDLIKPPVIDNSGKYFSQFPQKTRINNRINRKTLVIKKNQ